MPIKYSYILLGSNSSPVFYNMEGYVFDRYIKYKKIVPVIQSWWGSKLTEFYFPTQSYYDEFIQDPNTVTFLANLVTINQENNVRVHTNNVAEIDWDRFETISYSFWNFATKTANIQFEVPDDTVTTTTTIGPT